MGTAPSVPAAWFARPIEVRILRVDGSHVRIGIEAAEGLLIWRGSGRTRMALASGVTRVSDPWVRCSIDDWEPSGG
jgi:hypothetical protein